MAISGKFVADFASFHTAVQQAETHLRSFESGSNKVEASLNRMVDSFSGRKIITDAQLMAEAVERIGGTSRLTEAELGRLQRTAVEATSKMRAMGIDIPPGLQKIADSTRAIEAPTSAVTTKMVALGATLGTFAGNFAYNAVQRGISSLIGLGAAAITSAGEIDDMGKKLGISAEAVQGFKFAAEQSGTTMDTFGSAINRLNINLATGDKSTVAALRAAGLELGNLRKMNTENALLAVADAVMKIPNPMEQVRVGAQLMGKTFVEMMPAIQDNLRKTAEAAGKMSNETVKRLADAEDALAELGTRWTIAAGGLVASALDTTAKMNKAWEENNWMGRIGKFTLIGTGVLAIADQLGLLGVAAKKAAGDIELLDPALDKSKESLDADAEAAKRATDRTKELADINSKLWGTDLVARAQTYLDAIHAMGGQLPTLKAGQEELTKVFGPAIAAMEQTGRTGEAMYNTLIAKQRELLGLTSEGLLQSKNIAFDLHQGVTVQVEESTRLAIDGARASIEAARESAEWWDTFQKEQAEVVTASEQRIAEMGAKVPAEHGQMTNTMIGHWKQYQAAADAAIKISVPPGFDWTGAYRTAGGGAGMIAHGSIGGILQAPSMRSFQRGTHGYENFGSGTPAMLHGWEKVTPRGSGGEGVTVNVAIDARESFYDSPAGVQRLADKVSGAIMAQLRASGVAVGR